MNSYVVCPETISSPAPPQDWISANMPCGLEVEIHRLGPVMEMRCPRGHKFFATPRDVLPTPPTS